MKHAVLPVLAVLLIAAVATGGGERRAEGGRADPGLGRGSVFPAGGEPVETAEIVRRHPELDGLIERAPEYHARRGAGGRRPAAGAGGTVISWLAGQGFADEADWRSVCIVRRGARGSGVVIVVDVVAFGRGDVAQDVALEAGDLVLVPRRAGGGSDPGNRRPRRICSATWHPGRGAPATLPEGFGGEDFWRAVSRLAVRCDFPQDGAAATAAFEEPPVKTAAAPG